MNLFTSSTSIATLFLTLFPLVGIFTQATYTADSLGPITKIELRESTYDFGEIISGDIVTHVFSFTNTGDQPLLIMDAKGSCGCTVPQFPIKPIAPGETASITVQFNSRNKFGQRNQRVTLTTNTQPAQHFMYLTGIVLRKDDNTGITIDDSAPEAAETLSPDCFAIYPNPTADLLKLDVSAENLGKTATISIHTQSGQLMAQRSIEELVGTVSFEVGHYPPGSYVARLQIGKARPEVRCFVVVD